MPTGRIVEPTFWRGDMLCACGATMHCEIGGELGGKTHVWWRCDEQAAHRTPAVPLPRALARLGDLPGVPSGATG